MNYRVGGALVARSVAVMLLLLSGLSIFFQIINREDHLIAFLNLNLKLLTLGHGKFIRRIR